MKLLKIIKCSDPQMWYAELIGDYLPFIREDGDGYWSREPAGYSNLVRREDAQVIDDEHK